MKSTTLQIVCLIMILSGYVATGASAGDRKGNGFIEVESPENLHEGNDGPDGRSGPLEEESKSENGDGNPHDRISQDEGKLMWAAGRGSSSGGGLMLHPAGSGETNTIT